MGIEEQFTFPQIGALRRPCNLRYLEVVITNALGMPLRPQPAAVAAFKDFLLVSSRGLSRRWPSMATVLRRLQMT